MTRVILNNAVIDAELVQALGQFTCLDQLTLDGSKLQEWTLLSNLPRMQIFSVSQSNMSDVGASQLPLGLAGL